MDEMQMDRARLLEELRQRARELDYQEAVPFEAVAARDVPEEIRKLLEIIPVQTVEEVLDRLEIHRETPVLRAV